MSTTLPALPQLGSAAAAHDAFPRSFSPLRLPPSSGTFQWQQLPSHIVIRKLSSNDPPTAPSSSSNGAQVSPSIVVIIIVLTIIFFLSAFLHLLIRWLARNPRGRGSNGRSIVTLTALQGQLQQLFHMHDSGIEQALIDALPVFVYKSVMTGLKEGADCAICLCEFQSDDRLRLLPSCSHAFHMGCIDTWLLSHSTCPLCRTALQPECWIGEADGGMVLDSSRRRSSSNSITQLPPLHESAACGDDIHAAPSVRSHSSQLLDDAKSLTGDSGAASMALELQGCGGQSQRSLGSHSTALTEGASSFISFNEELSERASSTLGSGRRLSVKLGKCRFNKQGQHNPVPHQRGASASQSHSKGSYDYILNPMNLELVVPAFPSNRSQVVSSRRLDLLGHRSSASAECVEANALGNCGGVSSPSSEHMSSCWASASFRRLRNAEEKACVPHVREPGNWVSADPNNSSTGTSMRGNVSSSETPSSPEATQKVSMSSGGRLNAVNCKLDEQKTHSKRAVSFRLPGPPAGSMIKASASRRALSENEAFAFWEVISDPVPHSVDHMDPSSTPCMDNGSSVHRSSSFAKRTMDWLVGWQKRTVHPHAINPEVVELPNV